MDNLNILNMILTVNEAADEFGIKRNTLRKALVNESYNFKIGDNCRKTKGSKSPWLVSREAVRQYVEKTS